MRVHARILPDCETDCGRRGQYVSSPNPSVQWVRSVCSVSRAHVQERKRTEDVCECRILDRRLRRHVCLVRVAIGGRRRVVASRRLLLHRDGDYGVSGGVRSVLCLSRQVFHCRSGSALQSVVNFAFHWQLPVGGEPVHRLPCEFGGARHRACEHLGLQVRGGSQRARRRGVPGVLCRALQGHNRVCGVHGLSEHAQLAQREQCPEQLPVPRRTQRA